MSLTRKPHFEQHGAWQKVSGSHSCIGGSQKRTDGSLGVKYSTAINLTVFHLPRLSVDIDLDYCSEGNREEMLEQRQKISEDLKKFMQTQGYSLNPQSRSRHSLDSFVFTYTNLGGMRDNIKVEINYSLRRHLFELEDKPVLSDVIHMEHLVTVLSPVELFAAKINALLSRAAARDMGAQFLYEDEHHRTETARITILTFQYGRRVPAGPAFPGDALPAALDIVLGIAFGKVKPPPF